jgi:secondary thiamine-phosphate synthase enzyme
MVPPATVWRQAVVRLAPRPRGFHLVTDELLAGMPDLGGLAAGLVHFFIQHTSASLTLNENADPDVRADMERWSRAAAPDGAPYLVHDAEGADDMPAHIKASLFGSGVLVPVRAGRLALGTWQGLWLGEHRDHGGGRSVVITVMGG